MAHDARLKRYRPDGLSALRKNDLVLASIAIRLNTRDGGVMCDGRNRLRLICGYVLDLVKHAARYANWAPTVFAEEHLFKPVFGRER